MIMPKNPVVAIDGPAGSGKSTVARRVAEALGLPALDTGAMYRALTWAVLDAGIDPADTPAVIALTDRFELDVGPPVRVAGRDVHDAIRTPEVSASVSVVAAVPEVRVVLVRAQREWIAVHGGGVVEGRDIGTVVAPDALLKIYLEASEEERARRRQRQDDTGPGSGEATGGGLAATQAAIRRRDSIDSGRAASPLAVAEDAVVLDTTGLSVDGVVEEVVRRYRAALIAAALGGSRRRCQGDTPWPPGRP
jgi:cytidylate kinase